MRSPDVGHGVVVLSTVPERRDLGCGTVTVDAELGSQRRRLRERLAAHDGPQAVRSRTSVWPYRDSIRPWRFSSPTTRVTDCRRAPSRCAIVVWLSFTTDSPAGPRSARLSSRYATCPISGLDVTTTSRRRSSSSRRAIEVIQRSARSGDPVSSSVHRCRDSAMHSVSRLAIASNGIGAPSSSGMSPMTPPARTTAIVARPVSRRACSSSSPSLTIWTWVTVEPGGRHDGPGVGVVHRPEPAQPRELVRRAAAPDRARRRQG